MGWESRYGGKYYYNSVRTPDGRVEKRYHGNGPAARAMAELDTEAMARRRDEVGAVAAERARLAPIDAAMAALDEACRLATEASLTASGFHMCNYAWRRRRALHDNRGGGGGPRRRR